MTTKTDLRRTLTKTGFSAWLEKHRWNKIVGYARLSYSCPIANYLSYALDESISVGAIQCGARSARINLPAWATCFIDEIDGDRNIKMRNINVNAKRASKILAKC